MIHRMNIRIGIIGLLMLFTGTSVWASSSQSVSFDDPWQRLNRTVFEFNDTLDTYALRPVAVRYETYTPKPVQGLVTNFFSNLGDVRNFANALLQFKLEDAGVSLLRFVINSTVGQLGLVDVATPLGLSEKHEDFGLTLADWGLPSGPYLVLPFLGPSTVRSAVGLVPDGYTYPPNYTDWKVDFGLSAADVIQKRTGLLKTEKLLTGDKYTFIRDAYLQTRKFQITGEQPHDDF